jgi:hypothetical protein
MVARIGAIIGTFANDYLVMSTRVVRTRSNTCFVLDARLDGSARVGLRVRVVARGIRCISIS